MSRRQQSASRLCSIHHHIPVTMHTPAAYDQWSVFDHNGGNQLAVLGTGYGIWWPWYGQFEVGDYNLFSSVYVLELLQWPQCWFHKIDISAMYSYFPLGLYQLLNVGVDQWFCICIVDPSSGSISWYVRWSSWDYWFLCYCRVRFLRMIRLYGSRRFLKELIGTSEFILVS